MRERLIGFLRVDAGNKPQAMMSGKGMGNCLVNITGDSVRLGESILNCSHQLNISYLPRIVPNLLYWSIK